ncbi:GtrA family protein [Pseudoduganella namucuonensis]|uniref:GtrA-like protein n=1 Tax=Pseudoduganella namucuonensis TaxID=1035707 RepID=A0A1I7FT20_9BURK|nr:GtrA family protein [Pseudoduganella namucuonensis]SFU39297.1 GtrA-like protein [Pseudoduganella namucuonensis]
MFKLSPRVLVYLAGGVLSAAIDLGAMHLLMAGGMPTIPATTLAFVAGLLFNYTYHARVTFRAGGANAAPAGASFARYLCVVALGYAVTIALVAAGEALLGSPMAGKLVALPATAALGYVLGKIWIFV